MQWFKGGKILKTKEKGQWGPGWRACRMTSSCHQVHFVTVGNAHRRFSRWFHWWIWIHTSTWFPSNQPLTQTHIHTGLHALYTKAGSILFWTPPRTRQIHKRFNASMDSHGSHGSVQLNETSREGVVGKMSRMDGWKGYVEGRMNERLCCFNANECSLKVASGRSCSHLYVGS